MDDRILLVDDEDGIRTVLSISLEDIGYTVHAARDGDEALQLFSELRPPIVLTDIKMPGMDGIELLKTIKRIDPDTEVIMITGHGDMDLAIKSLKHEATDFITKPIHDDALEIALKRAREKILMREQLRHYTENLEDLVREKSARLVQVERLAAVGQAVEGLTSAFWELAGSLEGGLKYFGELPCLVSIHNRDLKVVATNPLYRERLGEKVGRNSWEIYGNASLSTACPAGETFETGTGRRVQRTIRYQTGVEVPAIVHTAPIRNKDGNIELVLEISADVTEMKRLQEELRTTRQRYQELFDEVPCYISVQDRDLNLTAVNRRFSEDFDEGIGHHCYSIYKHRQEPCPNCPVLKTFEDGKSHQAEMVVSPRSGDQYNVLIWTAPIRNAAGEITQVMEMSTNITQIRQLQDNLSSLGLMIGSVSHGIKGILTGLDAGLYMLESGFSKNRQDQIEEGFDVVKMMVERMRNVVSDILYYVKERPLTWERVDVMSFVNDIALMIEPKIRKEGLELTCDFRRPLDEFEVDPVVVRSALINILDNAIEACAEDTVKSGHRISFSARKAGGRIIFDIADNGIGMDAERKESIFTLFFSSKGKRGTGLGLYIANKVVRQHGGAIRVESEPGKGSRFRIQLPQTLPESVKRLQTAG